MINKVKTLRPGMALCFGNAFKVPISMYFQKANPEPLSNNVDVSSVWYQDGNMM